LTEYSPALLQAVIVVGAVEEMVVVVNGLNVLEQFNKGFTVVTRQPLSVAQELFKL